MKRQRECWTAPTVKWSQESPDNRHISKRTQKPYPLIYGSEMDSSETSTMDRAPFTPAQRRRQVWSTTNGTPSYKTQSTDVEEKFNVETITWKAVTLKLGDKKYKIRLDDDGKRTDMVYDYASFERAKAVPGAKTLYLGKLVITGKKAKIIPDE